jgi:hypothetical protein
VPVVSDPHATTQEDYYPICDKGFYKEKTTGREFRFQYIPGLDYPIRYYYTPNYPLGTRPYKEEEIQKIARARAEVLDKYIKPTVLPVPTLTILNLQALQRGRTTGKISDIPFWHYTNDLNIHTINDDRPIPCSLQAYISGIEQDRLYLKTNVLKYIKPRYLDWVEAGGYTRYTDGTGPPFWIDLWSEEAIQLADFPDTDNHPRILLENEWKNQWHNWWLANKRAQNIKELEELGFTRNKLLRALENKKARAKAINILTNKGVTQEKIKNYLVFCKKRKTWEEKQEAIKEPEPLIKRLRRTNSGKF